MQKTSRDAVIVSFCRTPVGKFGGALSAVRPDDLLALVFAEALARSKIPAINVDEVIAGCANQAGEDNRNVARMACLLAGLPYSVPAVTVNRLCASGLEAVSQAARAIKLGDCEVVLAGGVESMSRAPFVFGRASKAFMQGAPSVYDSSLGWRFPNQKMSELFPLESMGETAENIVREYKISRQDQDEFAFFSHKKAIRAQDDGRFSKEIVSIGQVDKDEGPRADTTLEKLATLKPVFRANGSVTAGNSSTLNDGAAAIVITSREFALANGLKIQARILGAAAAGVDPRFMGLGPVPATKKVLDRLSLISRDIQIAEINEAFSAQVLAVTRELKLGLEIVNINGGAIALGHPLGCSGARILISLISVMQQQQQSLGLATLCVGVGQGLSMVVERE